MRRVGIILGVLLLVALIGVAAGYIALQRVDWNEYKQPAADAVEEATGRRLDLGGEVDLQIGLLPGVRIEQVAFANADWGSRAEMATLEKLVVRLRLMPLLGGEVVVDHIELVGLDVLLETRDDGTVNWEFEPPPAETGSGERGAEPPDSPAQVPEQAPAERDPAATAPSPKAEEPLGVRVHRVEIRDSVIVLRDQGTGEDRRIGLARLSAVATDPDSADSPIRIELDASYGDEPIALNGEVAGLLGEAMALDVKVEAAGTSLDLNGGLGNPREELALDLAVRVVSEQIARLGALTGGELPALPPLEASLKLQGGGDRYEVRDLALSLGTTRISGDVDAVLGGERPRIDARLVAERIDLADLGPPGEQARRVRPAAGIQLVAEERPEPLFSREPLPLEGLAAIDASVSLEAALLQADAIQLTKLGVDLTLEDAKLRVDRFATEIARGRVDAKLTLDAASKRPRLTLVGTTRGVRVGDLAAAQGSDVVRDGPLDLDFDLAGRGASLHDIMASLGGRLKLAMGEALVKNEYAVMALSDLESLAQGRTGEEAPVQCVFGDFALEGGVARPDALVVHLGSIALFGTGKIDLGKEKMKLEFDRVAQEVAASTALPPFTLKGPLTDPEPGIAAGALLGKAVDLFGNRNGRERPRSSDCRELWVAYQAQQEKRAETTDRATEAGKDVLDSIKGLFD